MIQIKLIGIGVVVLSILTGVVIIYFKLKKGKKARIQNKVLKRQKNSTVKIQRERDRLNHEENKIVDDINNADSDKLSDAYSNKLSDLPD